ncbi:MAG: dTDP-4-dehydrorhamnose reductase [Acidihalobacter sp.]
MRVLITGAGGQLGRELQRTAPAGAVLAAPTHAELDITDAAAVRRYCAEFDPEWIVNAAAYTAVDRAESEASQAYVVNAEAVRHLAEAAQAQGARLAQVSTDFVFDGAQGRPYRPDDAPHPLGVYGASKLAGERAAAEVLGERALIVRTAWVYAAQGHNFMRTMLRLMRERDRLGVVADQIGTPTSARGLAEALWAMLAAGLSGIQHWTDAGVASWYDFALAIRDEALALGLLERAVPVAPLTTAEYPTPAPRAPFTVLDKSATIGRAGRTSRGGLSQRNEHG